jgi:hypothetical protein
MHALLMTIALGGTMTIDARYAGMWYGKPPLKRLDFDLTVKNPSDKARWLFVPGTIGSSSPGGVYGVTIYETPAPLWNIEGSAGGWAVKIAPKSEATLEKLGISAWYSELPPRVILPAVLADDITIGGQSITAFAGFDRTTSGVSNAQIDRMKTKVAAYKQTEKEANGLHKDVPLAFVGRTDAPITAWLVGVLVTIDGKAEEAKEGALLIGKDGEQTWIDGAKNWPRGKRVRVSGKVIEKHDRPVFVPKKGEPQSAGIPVPEGTDLHAASHRYLIGEATFTLLPD